MKIGIIGKGKMGKDIFNLFFQFDNKIILICRKFEDIEKETLSIQKQLKRMFKRGYMDAYMLEKKMQSFIVSNDIYALKNCELVIESVFEDKELKQDIFQRLDSIVNTKCILASNTSSIPLNSIFEKCLTKDRCLGIHFFFPIKITRIVEINKTRFTDQRYVEIVSELLIGMDKLPIELNEDTNMVLTQMILTMIAHVYLIYEENYLSIEEIDKVLKDNLLTYGTFEVVDSIGINILTHCIDNLINDRNKKLYAPLRIKGEKATECGYHGGPGGKGLIAFEQEHPITYKKIGETELNEYKQNIILSLESVIINELSYIITNRNVDKDLINVAIQEVFGLIEDPITILKRVGNQKIEASLLDSYQRFQDNIYKPFDLNVLMINEFL
ncbi:3-hydroxyacyl-CoA dehydrogenase family protein [Clostridium estertheticum]|uniref:3-hydroxyacyl-CoA dehydrogenase family protein n=1 Tax=Clostridium estertheticum TaxID=238834 RepID=UPI001C7CEADA|nr:3-hydroxyacyl-CoA dehydrogenase family protein [Clostridium estertheticum]MBX4266839.1 3-hydroxyacyl-CoA dehydrogenase family protein [Clostridium estertheticum]WLC89023.1 3-hydroxyacyl-CoA dehydrogenase family protein [Clostridium estertheticum]